MTMLLEVGGPTSELADSDLKRLLIQALEKLGDRQRVMIVPPDFTRFHSKAGELTKFAYEFYGDAVKDIMPALGTHKAMSEGQLSKMFQGIPHSLFRIHDWRNDVVTIGHVPVEMVERASDGKVKESWPAQVNKLLWNGGHDLILSIGQVVPHEVMGMANYNKNIFVGIGGSEAINFSHFIGAVYGMERMMGRSNNPLRQILNYASDHFLAEKPVVYLQTVIARRADGKLVTRGLFVGDDSECFEKAAALSLQVNFTMLEAPLRKVVVYLDPEEFHSTWLGNKSIYRTRMAIEDDGELVVLAPGVQMFGEDDQIDALIRKYGYRSTPEVLEFLRQNRDLSKNLSAAAHLIHGSSEGRFRITYCPGHLSRDEIESVGYVYAPLTEMFKKYNPETLNDGLNIVEGEEVFFISNPAIGLWAFRGRFNDSDKPNPSQTAAASAEAEFSSPNNRTNFKRNSVAQENLDRGVGGGPFRLMDEEAEPRSSKRKKADKK